jgi:hypothetical protein
MNTYNKNNDKTGTRHPTSANGQQCIGPCYYSNTYIVHPLTLEEIGEIDHNFCPVNTFIYTDPQTGKSKLLNVDKCYVPTARETHMDDLLRDNVIAPQFSFSSEYFVKIYYKINHLDDMLKWLDDHKNDPYKTKLRVFDNSMVVYGNQLNVIDHRLVHHINSIMVENLPKIYRHIKQYFIVVDGTVKLIAPDSKYQHNKSDIGDIRNYIKEKFLGNDNIHQFISKFIRYYKEELSNRNITYTLVNHMIDYITKRIILTLDQE